MTKYKEEWRCIPGVHKNYEVSSFGRIRRALTSPCARGTRPGKLLKQHKHCKLGRMMVSAPRPDGTWKRWYGHRLVAAAYLGPCPKGLEVNHIDGDYMNNVVWNLEYVTHAENIRHSYALGMHPKSPRNVGEDNGMAKLTRHEVEAIRALYQQFAAETATRYGITPEHVKSILKRRVWKEEANAV